MRRDEVVVIDGMHGMGDNVHQRAVVRHLLASRPSTEFWLKTPWPCLYHDLVGDRLHVVDPRTSLRTQRKNSVREQGRYVRLPPTYHSQRSVPAQFVQKPDGTGRHDPQRSNTFTTPTSIASARPLIAADALDRPQHKPVISRLLVERTEWCGCAARNPTRLSALFTTVSATAFVVSLATSCRKWKNGNGLDDLLLHKGERMPRPSPV